MEENEIFNPAQLTLSHVTINPVKNQKRFPPFSDHPLRISCPSLPLRNYCPFSSFLSVVLGNKDSLIVRGVTIIWEFDPGGVDEDQKTPKVIDLLNRWELRKTTLYKDKQITNLSQGSSAKQSKHFIIPPPSQSIFKTLHSQPPGPQQNRYLSRISQFFDSASIYQIFNPDPTTLQRKSPYIVKFVPRNTYKRVAEKFKKSFEHESCRTRTGLYETIVYLLASAKGFNWIEEILEDQKKYRDISKVSFSVSLISLYGKSIMFKHAQKVFDERLERNYKCTVLSLNVLVGACVNFKNFDLVDGIFKEFPKKFFTPSAKPPLPPSKIEVPLPSAYVDPRSSPSNLSHFRREDQSSNPRQSHFYREDQIYTFTLHTHQFHSLVLTELGVDVDNDDFNELFEREGCSAFEGWRLG